MSPVIRSVSRANGSDQEPKAAARQNGERIAAGFCDFTPTFPGRSAARSALARSDALQTRDRNRLRTRSDPGSAMHRSTLHRIRETRLLVPFEIPHRTLMALGGAAA